MNKSKASAILLSALLMSTAMAGCGGGTDNGSETGKDSGGTMKLTMMTTWLPESTGSDDKSRYAQIEKYLEANPEIELQNDSIGHDDFVVKIKALIAANELPDIWSPRGDMIPPAVDNELIYTAGEILEQVDGWEELFDPGSFDDFRYNDEVWAIPNQLQGCSYLFCNMDLLKECGVEKAPETWEELLAAVEKVKTKGLIPICAGNKGKSPVGDCVMSWLCDRYTGTDWFYSMKEQKGARFTDPEFVEALKAFEELVATGAFNQDANSIDEDMGRSYYANGESPMFFSGAWSTDWIELNCSEEIINATKLVLPPSIEGVKGSQNAVSGGAGWGISLTKELEGERLAKAAELAYYLTNDDYTTECLSRGLVRYPAKTPEGADFSKLGPVTQQYLDSLENSVFCPDYYVLMEPSPLEEFGNVIQEIMIGSTTPEDGAKRVDDAYEQYVINK